MCVFVCVEEMWSCDILVLLSLCVDVWMCAKSGDVVLVFMDIPGYVLYII